MKRVFGFTLIEAVLTIAILAGGIVGILALYQTNIARSDEMEQTLIAASMAQEQLERIVQDKTYQGYSYVTNSNYTSPENLAGYGYPGYTRTTVIQEVDATNLTTPQNNSGYKRITVSVAVTGGLTVSLNTLVTEWSFPNWGNQ